MNESTRKYISEHLNDDVNKLALSKFPENIDKQLVVRQIQARQLLKKKLPSWAENDDLLFPRRLSLEQCSSESTANYKSQMSKIGRFSDAQKLDSCRLEGERVLVDLTGGMGVDTAFLSDDFDKTVYVEAQEELCELARHNFNVLNKNIEVVNAKAEDFLSQCDDVDCIYLDPARRDEHGRKMVSLHDCSPDVAELQDLLFEKTNTVIVKLSPMLDIDIVRKELKNIKEIHVVAVKNECKELLVVCQRTTDNRQQTSHIAHNSQLKAIDLHEGWNFVFTEDEEQEAVVTFADVIGKYLYEPGVACMKAGPFKLLSQRYNIKKLHRNSHLYTSDEFVSEFPGRVFEIVDVVSFDKKAKKVLGQRTTDNGQHSKPKVSIATRNFPLSAEELKKHLAFKDGNDFYLFGTTIRGENKILILGKKCNDV